MGKKSSMALAYKLSGQFEGLPHFRQDGTTRIILRLLGMKPESWNTMKGKAFYIYDRYANEAKAGVFDIVRKFKPPYFDVPVRIIFACYFKSRRLDSSNMILKPFEDALHECGILKDDSPAFVKSTHFIPLLDKANPRIEIHIVADEFDMLEEILLGRMSFGVCEDAKENPLPGLENAKSFDSLQFFN